MDSPLEKLAKTCSKQQGISVEDQNNTQSKWIRDPISGCCRQVEPAKLEDAEDAENQNTPPSKWTCDPISGCCQQVEPSELRDAEDPEDPKKPKRILVEDIFSASTFERDLLLPTVGGTLLSYLPIYRTRKVAVVEKPWYQTRVKNVVLKEPESKNVPLHPRSMGLEVGVAHGYFLVGPFVTFCPFAESENAPILGAVSVIGLTLIATLALWAYGLATFITEGEYYLSLRDFSIKLYGDTPIQQEKFLNFALMKRAYQNVESLRLETSVGWTEFTLGILAGGITGATLAAILLTVTQ
jgi:hypothetical protein